VALVAAVIGGALALGIGAASGWLGGTETVLVETAAGSDVEPAAGDPPASLARAGFDPAAIYRERSPGVVTIYSLFAGHREGTPGTQAQGSGFVVSSDGYILTNSHVITDAGGSVAPADVQQADEVYVEFTDGDRVRATIVGFDVFDDVGLLKVDPADHTLQPVPLGDSSDVVVGEPVAAIGSPFGQESSLAVGVVSATQRAVSALTSSYTVVDAIQIDAPINRGNSGGPLFDARGEVIGINAQIRSESGNAEGVGFAIPINAARRSMEQLIADGRVRYAWVGISTQTVTPSIGRDLGLGTLEGAAVQDVVAGSPAARAGLRAGTSTEDLEGLDFTAGGDVVVAIDGQRVRTTEDMIRIVTGSLEPGHTATFTVVRDRKRVKVPVTLGERPLDPSPAR
jgi:S1-C subfamily serine protease